MKNFAPLFMLIIVLAGALFSAADTYAICIILDEGEECTATPDPPASPTIPPDNPTPAYGVSSPSKGGVNIQVPDLKAESLYGKPGGWIKQDAIVIPSSEIMGR